MNLRQSRFVSQWKHLTNIRQRKKNLPTSSPLSFFILLLLFFRRQYIFTSKAKSFLSFVFLNLPGNLTLFCPPNHWRQSRVCITTRIAQSSEQFYTFLVSKALETKHSVLKVVSYIRVHYYQHKCIVWCVVIEIYNFHVNQLWDLGCQQVN